MERFLTYGDTRLVADAVLAAIEQALMLRPRLEARDNLDAAARWYEAQEPGLCRQLLAEVLLVFQRIRSNPAAYPTSYRGTRRALIRRFPYGVVYLPVPE